MGGGGGISGSTPLVRSAWTRLLPVRKCCEVSASAFISVCKKKPVFPHPWLRELGLPGELPGTGALSKRNGLCVQTRVLSLTLTGLVSVARGQGRWCAIQVQNLYLKPWFSSGPMKSPVGQSSSYGLSDKTNFDHCNVFDLCSDLSLACGRQKERLRLD